MTEFSEIVLDVTVGDAFIKFADAGSDGVAAALGEAAGAGSGEAPDEIADEWYLIFSGI